MSERNENYYLVPSYTKGRDWLAVTDDGEVVFRRRDGYTVRYSSPEEFNACRLFRLPDFPTWIEAPLYFLNEDGETGRKCWFPANLEEEMKRETLRFMTEAPRYVIL